MLNTQRPLQQRGQFLPRYTRRGHRGALFGSSALALVLCNVFTPAVERETVMDTNSNGAQCPLVTLETIHTLFITGGTVRPRQIMFIRTLSLVQTLVPTFRLR